MSSTARGRNASSVANGYAGSPKHSTAMSPNAMMASQAAAQAAMQGMAFQYPVNAMAYPQSPGIASSPKTPNWKRTGSQTFGDTPTRDSKRMRDSSIFLDNSKSFIKSPSPSTSVATPVSDKQSKGLRHFSREVCQKVKEKGITTYSEVADELVAERLAMSDEELRQSNEPHGPKNIRRRVYDALNVLYALKIISKEKRDPKKEIRWIGLPNNSVQEYRHMEELRARKLERIRRKTEHLQELIIQQIAFKNLVKRNAEKSSTDMASGNCVHLPFIIINTDKNTNVKCQMSEDKSEYFFDFNKPFEIHDDIEILKRMGLAYNIDRGQCTLADLEAARVLVPTALYPYLKAMVKSDDGMHEDGQAPQQAAKPEQQSLKQSQAKQKQQRKSK